jgi:hypothetical protein
VTNKLTINKNAGRCWNQKVASGTERERIYIDGDVWTGADFGCVHHEAQ